MSVSRCALSGVVTREGNGRHFELERDDFIFVPTKCLLQHKSSKRQVILDMDENTFFHALIRSPGFVWRKDTAMPRRLAAKLKRLGMPSPLRRVRSGYHWRGPA